MLLDLTDLTDLTSFLYEHAACHTRTPHEQLLIGGTALLPKSQAHAYMLHRWFCEWAPLGSLVRWCTAGQVGRGAGLRMDTGPAPLAQRTRPK